MQHNPHNHILFPITLHPATEMQAFMQATEERSAYQPEKKASGLFIRQIIASTFAGRIEDQPKKMRSRPLSAKAVVFLCLLCFLAGTLFSNGAWRHVSLDGGRGHPVVANQEGEVFASITQDFVPPHKQVTRYISTHLICSIYLFIFLIRYFF